MSAVTPGLVFAHHHLYSALARGMPAPPKVADNFQEIFCLFHDSWFYEFKCIAISADVREHISRGRKNMHCMFRNHPSHGSL